MGVLNDAALIRVYFENLGDVFFIVTGSVVMLWLGWTLARSLGSDEDGEPRRQAVQPRAAWSKLTPVLRGRRAMALALGVIWLIDGVLQAQPVMVTRSFVSTVLGAAAHGNPSWLYHAVLFGSHLWQSNPIVANIGATFLQIGLGALILFGPDRIWGRVGLILSIVWSVAVWFFGEGLGGTLAGGASAITGAPGAALLYALAAAALLLPVRRWENGQVMAWSRNTLAALWLLSAGLQLQAQFFTASGLTDLFSMAAYMQQPGWMAAPILHFMIFTAGSPVQANVLLASMMAAYGVLVLRLRVQPLAIFSVVWLLFIWWIGQDFGGIVSGSATDLNAGIIWALLLVPVLVRPRWQPRVFRTLAAKPIAESAGD